MFKSIRLRPAALVVSGILFTVTFYIGQRPYYNWDMFPYMAVIMEEPGVPFSRVHGDVYGAAATYLPPQDFLAISARQPELAKDPQAFQSILKYFTIKPGYTALAKLFYVAGVHPVLATVLPSLLGYLAIGFILFFWAQSIDKPASAALLTLLVALSPPMIDLARYSSPDMMCTALAVGGFACLLTARPVAGLCLFYIAIWVRPDAALLLFPMTLALAFGKLIRWDLAVALFLGGIATVWIIFGGTGIIREYVEVDPAVGRWGLFLQGLRSPSPYLIMFILMSAALLYFRKRVLLPSRSLLLLAGLSAFAARYLLFPVFEDRFNLRIYFLILMIGWEALMTWRSRTALPKP